MSQSVVTSMKSKKIQRIYVLNEIKIDIYMKSWKIVKKPFFKSI